VSEKIIQCPCGTVLTGADDQDVVTRAQQHAAEVHGITAVDEPTERALAGAIHRR
jgi:predicted small metal-binding protein